MSAAPAPAPAPAPKSIGTAELALRLLVSRGAAAYFAYLIRPEEVAEVIEDVHAELCALGEGATIAVIAPSRAGLLLQQLASAAEEVILVDAQHYTEADWRLLDRRRSSLGRDGIMVFLATPSGFEELMRAAPNLASWLGGFVFSFGSRGSRGSRGWAA